MVNDKELLVNQTKELSDLLAKLQELQKKLNSLVIEEVPNEK